MRTFGTSKELAEASKSLAANQGLYNGFLAAGLVWGLFYPEPVIGRQIQLFFVICVVVAAVYGALTANKSILLKQGLPAILALISLWIL
jgi:putative membrane protein